MPHCGDCGAHYTSADQFCPSCGAATDASPDAPVETTGTTTDQTAYFVGVVLGFILLIVAPYAVVFLAIPESIAKMFGSSLQSNFPAGARENDYIRGVMLVVGWFGNFLVMLIVLAIVVIVALVVL